MKDVHQKGTELERQADYVRRVWSQNAPCPNCKRPHNCWTEGKAGDCNVKCACGKTLHAELLMFGGIPIWEMVE